VHLITDDLKEWASTGNRRNACVFWKTTGLSTMRLRTQNIYSSQLKNISSNRYWSVIAGFKSYLRSANSGIFAGSPRDPLSLCFCSLSSHFLQTLRENLKIIFAFWHCFRVHKTITLQMFLCLPFVKWHLLNNSVLIYVKIVIKEVPVYTVDITWNLVFSCSCKIWGYEIIT
jgi:hypothetical protein